MEKTLAGMRVAPLFRGMSDDEMRSLAPCLSPDLRTYPKGALILREGDSSPAVGIVVSGSVHIVRDDISGARSILAEVPEGSLFGESYACSGTNRIPVTVVAATDAEVLFIDYQRIVGTCPSACAFHSKLIENMIAILAAKNVALSEKHEVLSRRSTRDKITAYLQSESRKAGAATFTIPFSRQEMADYLCVDRSAMSRELGRMQDEGLISYYRNSFRLHQKAR